MIQNQGIIITQINKEEERWGQRQEDREGDGRILIPQTRRELLLVINIYCLVQQAF